VVAIAVAEAAFGVLILLFVLQDIFRVVVMPRPNYGRSFSKVLLRVTWAGWRPFGLHPLSVQRRESILAAFPHLALLLLLWFWVLGLVVGYALILHALRGEISPSSINFGTALYAAGVSLLTVGFGDIVPTGGLARFVTLLIAASGPALIGLVLALLFSLYASFQRREALITTLDASAGAPPSGVRLLETYAVLDLQDQLPALFRSWELWTAEVLDSHLAYPLLAFFRSTHDNESWISALGAVLDAATLAIATAAPSSGSARLMYDLGCHAVEDISNYFGLTHEHETGVERDEFEAALVTLAEAGYALAPAGVAWDRFCDLRGRYAGPLNALAQTFVTPPALWVGDRATLHTFTDS
jgi:hypothetical protein